MKKKVVLAIIFLIIILLLAGTGFYIYSYTDYFKTDRQIFYKYLIEKNEMVSVLEDIKIPNESKSYKANTDISYIYNYDNRIEKMTDDQIVKNLKEHISDAEAIKGFSADIQSKVDKDNQKQSHIVNIKKDDEDILKVDVVRSGDSYGIKPEGILNAYIGIENNNIKELASKFDIPSENIEIPNKIDYENKKYSDFFEITDDEKKHIIDTYQEILYNEIPETCYAREKEQKVIIDEVEYNANKNILILNKEESINLSIKLLEKLKEDSITLNMITNKIKTIDQNNEYGKIENLTVLIQGYIDELNTVQKTKEEYIKMEVYDYNGQTIKLDLSVATEKKLELDFVGDGEQKTLYIKQQFTKNDAPAIIYDIKTSLLGANNITITKGKNSYKIEVILYNIKDIYERILKEKQEMYKSQNNNYQSNIYINNDGEIDELAESNTNDEETITKQDLDAIEDLYNKYVNTDSKLLKLGLNIEYVKNSDSNEEYTIYANICNTKIGARCKMDKEYTTDLGNIETLNSKNFVVLNKYTKDQIIGVVKLISDRIASTINEKTK